MSRLRIRSVKPDCWADESISPLSRDARLLFVVLLTFADDDGRFRNLPAQIIGHGYPEDEDVTVRKLGAWMSELVCGGIVVLYTVGASDYGTFPKWHKHQRINRYSPSKLPPYGGRDVAIVPHPTHDKRDEDSVRPHAQLTENSVRTPCVLTESSPPDREYGEEGNNNGARAQATAGPSLMQFNRCGRVSVA